MRHKKGYSMEWPFLCLYLTDGILFPRRLTMKYYLQSLACLLLLMGTPVHGAEGSKNKGKSQQPSPVAPAEIILKTEEGKKPAVFPHAKHQANNACDACHKNANFPADKKWDFKQGHALCMGCHKAKNEGPTKCNGCHE